MKLFKISSRKMCIAFSVVLKRATIAFILQTTFWTKSTKVAYKTRKLKAPLNRHVSIR